MEEISQGNLFLAKVNNQERCKDVCVFVTLLALQN